MLHTYLLNTNLIKIKHIQILYNLNHIDFKTHQFRLYLHRTTALQNSHLPTLHRFLKEVSLSWHFLVMPKIVSHPRFSSELDNLFPMLGSQVLHYLTISSSLDLRHGSVFIVQVKPWFPHPAFTPWHVEEGYFLTVKMTAYPYDSLTSFYPASCSLWSCLPIPHTPLDNTGIFLGKIQPLWRISSQHI